MTTGTLERIIRGAAARRAAAEERCDLCAAPVPPGHRHLLDGGSGELLCACRPCALLFVRDAASDGHYRLVPRRRLRLPPVDTAALGVPVGLAFFVARVDGVVVAHYPSPAGATRWEVDADAWRALVATCPVLSGLETEVEALLVGRERHWLVPVDDCLRLVAVVRREWRGLSGGSRVWPAVDEFFAGLTEGA